MPEVQEIQQKRVGLHASCQPTKEGVGVSGRSLRTLIGGWSAYGNGIVGIADILPLCLSHASLL